MWCSKKKSLLLKLKMSTCSDNGTECKGRFDHGIKTSMEIQTRITKNKVGNFNKNPTTFISSRIHIQ